VSTINGTPGDDILPGTDAGDVISGGAGNDRIDAGAGPDFLNGDTGNDIIDGGADFDTVIIDNFNSGPVTVDMVAGTATGAYSGNDTLLNIEHVMVSGSVGATMIGSVADEILQAYSPGRNIVSAGGGDDIVGDEGTNSVLDGGSGHNSVGLYRQAATPFTQIFTPGVNGTLADGTTYNNFEWFLLFTGSGDDSVTFNQLERRRVRPPGDFGNWWDAGGGNDTVMIDMSGSTTPLTLTQDQASANLYDNGPPQSGEIIGLINVDNYRIIGGSGNDLFNGGPGSDVFTGNGGNDQLVGGFGLDVARYSGLASDYRVDQISNTLFKITDLRGGSPDGVDTLIDIERVQWGDNSVTTLINMAPTVTTVGTLVPRNQTLSVSSFISVSDADNDTITRYQLFDGNNDPLSGHFEINGVVQAARTVIDVSAAQLAQTSFVTGRVNDPLQIRAYDGTNWSAPDNVGWSPFTISVPVNYAPVVTTSNVAAQHVQTIPLSGLISVSDGEADALTRYQLFDGTADPLSGHFMINGVVQAERTVLDITASQLGQTSFVAGFVTDNLQIRAYDGIDWSAPDNAGWSPFTVTVPNNHAPVVGTSNVTAQHAQTKALANLITVSDADNDTITRYQLFDGTADPNSGHFMINGVVQDERTVLDISASQLGQTAFIAGFVNDNLQIRAYDGATWSALDNVGWAPFTVSVPVNHAPVVSTSNVTAQHSQTIALSNLITVSDNDNDNITRYQLFDGTADSGSGYFVINGVVQAERSIIELTASQLAQTSFFTGLVGDNLQIRAFDGSAWSAPYNVGWSPFSITVAVNHAPAVATSNLVIPHGQSRTLASLITVSDADNDTITRYQLFDGTADPNSGHFVVNGVAQAERTVLDITASQLAQTSFLGGASSDDNLQIRAFDGFAWSAPDNVGWSPFHISVS
jgi:hypothetical protein